LKRSKLAGVFVVLAAAGGVIGVTALTGSASSPSGEEPVVDAAGLERLPTGQGLLVRSVDPAHPRRDGAVFALSPDGTSGRAGDLACKRVAANPDGAGFCLARHENGLDYEAISFGADYEPRARAFIQGVPDRARVSPDGRYGGYTSFDPDKAAAYFANGERFKTYTRIIDLRNGDEILRLEELRVERDGDRVQTEDANFWGVTFTDDNRFYATLAVAKQHYLIEGAVGKRVARVVGDHVECPALAPDGKRIAYKRRIGDQNRWRFHVRDLETGRDVALAEPRSIDDQPDWLSDDLVVYSDDKAAFAVPADGSGRPQRLAAASTSPAPIR
jgi:hypothetical protein